MKIIIVPAFGFRDDPNFKPNRLLSKEALAQSENGGIKIFTDKQAAVCLRELAVEFPIEVCGSGGETATATLILFHWVARQIGNLDNIEVIIVAAPQHQVRAVWCARRVGFKDIRLPKFAVAPTEERDYWAKDNKHWCTRGPGWWKIYETIGWSLVNLFPRLYPRMARARSY